VNKQTVFNWLVLLSLLASAVANIFHFKIHESEREMFKLLQAQIAASRGGGCGR
jgi:hypothetical protein